MLGALQVFSQITTKLQAETQALLAALRFAEQLHQLIFPQRCDRVAAVAARFVAHGNHNSATVRDALYLALEDTELRRIDKVVGGIDREKRGTDFFKVRTGIVVA